MSAARRVLTASLLGIVLLPAAALATGTLCGTVRDASSGVLVSGAGIFVFTTAGAYTGFEAVSDGSGQFCIAGIPAGTYDLQVRRDHYARTVVQNVQVVDDVTGVDIGVMPTRDVLLAPRPNPAQQNVEFRFDVAASGPVRLEGFDLMGRRLKGWASDAGAAGERAVGWDFRDTEGRAVAAGCYVVRLTTPGSTLTRFFTRVR